MLLRILLFGRHVRFLSVVVDDSVTATPEISCAFHKYPEETHTIIPGQFQFFGNTEITSESRWRSGILSIGRIRETGNLWLLTAIRPSLFDRSNENIAGVPNMLGAAATGETVPSASELQQDLPSSSEPPAELKALEDAIVVMLATSLAELRAEGALTAAAQARIFERVRRLMDARLDSLPNQDRLGSVVDRICRSLP